MTRIGYKASCDGKELAMKIISIVLLLALTSGFASAADNFDEFRLNLHFVNGTKDTSNGDLEVNRIRSWIEEAERQYATKPRLTITYIPLSGRPPWPAETSPVLPLTEWQSSTNSWMNTLTIKPGRKRRDISPCLWVTHCAGTTYSANRSVGVAGQTFHMTSTPSTARRGFG